MIKGHLTPLKKEQLKAHAKRHSKKHMDIMRREMKKGKSFTQAHNIAMRSKK